MFRFQLFVAGDTPNSVQALNNLSQLCSRYLPERHEIEVVDVIREPARALAESVFMTPTLVKLGPNAPRKIVGTLSNTALVLQTLGLETGTP